MIVSPDLQIMKEELQQKQKWWRKKTLENFSKTLFLNLKKWLDGAKVANQYLFQLAKERFDGKLLGEIYKIQVIKKDNKGIVCQIEGENNYQNKFFVTNKEIMTLKNDTIEDIETPKNTQRKDDPKLSKEANEYFRKKMPKYYKIHKEDFLEEIKYGDSVIVKIENKKMKRLHPDDIINEIQKYLKEQGETKKSAKKIQTALKFLNESNNSLADTYIKDFMELVRRKQRKRNSKATPQQLQAWLKNHKREFAEVLKRFINKEKTYVHKANDIDKSAAKFLLQLFGIDSNKTFHEIEHNEANTIKEWLLIDVGETATGLKVEKTTEIQNGEKIIKTKKIASEHSDKSDEAILTNRPSSTTQIIFKIFKDLWAINEKQLPHIQRFVNFVNTVDSMDYQVSAVDYPNNYKTMFGLYRAIPIQEIFEYFRNPEHTGFEKLTDKYMESIVIGKNKETNQEITLKDISENHKKRIEENIKNFNALKAQENRELYYKSTKFIVDIEDKIKDGPQVAGYYGYGFFKIYPKRGNIYIYSPKKLPTTIEGYPTDGHFLIINHPTQEDIETLFEKFSTITIQKTSLKDDMIAYLKKIQEKNTEKNITDQEFQERINQLPILKRIHIKEHEKRKGVINNVQRKIAFITLDREGKFIARFKVEDANILKWFKKGDRVKINISSLEEKDGKLFIEAWSMKKI